MGSGIVQLDWTGNNSFLSVVGRPVLRSSLLIRAELKALDTEQTADHTCELNNPLIKTDSVKGRSNTATAAQQGRSTAVAASKSGKVVASIAECPDRTHILKVLRSRYKAGSVAPFACTARRGACVCSGISRV